MTNLDLTNVPYYMNSVYIPEMENRQRINIFFGGAGSGKSFFIAQRIVYRLMAEPGHNMLVVRKVADTNRYSTFQLIQQVIEEWGLTELVKVNKSDLTITNPDNRNSILFRGMDDREKIKSISFSAGPLTDIWMEEASEFVEEDFIQLNLRMRGKYARQPYQLTMSFNPISAEHWLKRRFFDNPKKNATILKTTYKDNEFIDDEYKEELEAYKDTDPLYYQVYALGEWGNIGDTIFHNIVFETSPYKLEDYDEVLWGMDFGFNHYHAIEGIGIKDDELYSFSELYVRQKTNSDIIKINEEQGILKKEYRCTADSAEPKSIIDWQRAGYRIDTAKKGPDSVYAGIQFLKSRKWHIDPVKCPGLAAEVRGYSWRKNKAGEIMDEPIAIRDDGIAATRYAIECKMVDQQRYEVFFV